MRRASLASAQGWPSWSQLEDTRDAETSEKEKEKEKEKATPPFDPTVYFRPPKLDAASAIALGKMLMQAQPRDLPASSRWVVGRLEGAVKALEAAWRGSKLPPQSVDVRRVDQCLDKLWSALRGRLLPYAALPKGDPDRERAEVLLRELFPEGLTFLLLPYLTQHCESQRRLDHISSEGLGETLRELAGPRFLDALGQAHEAYGRALGIGAPRPTPASEVRVAEPLRAVQAAMRAYVLQLLALADADPGCLPAVRKALHPIDAFRAASKRRSAGGPVGERSAG